MDATSIGGESARVHTGVGCYKNFDHVMTGGCSSLRKDSLGPTSASLANQSATNLLDLASINNNNINQENQLLITHSSAFVPPPHDSQTVSQSISKLIVNTFVSCSCCECCHSFVILLFASYPYIKLIYHFYEILD